MTRKFIITELIIDPFLSTKNFLNEPNYQELEKTTTNLNSSEVFTSQVFSVRKYKTINVNVTSDVDSAPEGLKINYVNTETDCSDFVPTLSNMDYTANGNGWTYGASLKDSFESAVRGNCAWVTYTNGSSAQTSFKLSIFGSLK